MGSLPRTVLLTHLSKPDQNWIECFQDNTFFWLPLAKYEFFQKTFYPPKTNYQIIVSSPTSFHWLKTFYDPKSLKKATFFCVGKNTFSLLKNWCVDLSSIYYAKKKESMASLLDQYSDRWSTQTFWLGSSQGIQRHQERLLSFKSFALWPTHYNWPIYDLSEEKKSLLQKTSLITCSSMSAALTLSCHEDFIEKNSTVILSDKRLLKYCSENLKKKSILGSWKKILLAQESLNQVR